MLRNAFVVAIALAFPAVVHAQDLPRLDPVGNCRKDWTKAEVPDNRMYAFCMDREQTAYDGLKTTWQSMSTNVRRVCIGDWGNPAGGSYRMLQFCTERQAEAERQNSSGSFRW